MSDYADLAQWLRGYAREPWATIGGRPFAIEAANALDAQAKRIAELEEELAICLRERRELLEDL